MRTATNGHNATSQLKPFSHGQTGSSIAARSEGKNEAFIIPLLFIFSVVICLFVGICFGYGIVSNLG